MDISRPYRVISHQLDGAALSVLAGADSPLSARQIARLAPEGSQPGILKALDRLEGNGLVDVVRTGNASLYLLNRAHVAAPAVETLANLRFELFERIRLTVESWPVEPVNISIFGSAARRDGGIESDIDILAVLPDAATSQEEEMEDLVHQLAGLVRSWSGNRANISQLSESKLARLLESDSPLAEDLRRDSITITGTPVQRLRASQ